MAGRPLVMDPSAITPGVVTLINKKSLAARYSCTPRTINNLMRKGVLPYVKIGSLVRFDPADCDRALAAFRVKSRFGSP